MVNYGMSVPEIIKRNKEYTELYQQNKISYQTYQQKFIELSDAEVNEYNRKAAKRNAAIASRQYTRYVQPSLQQSQQMQQQPQQQPQQNFDATQSPFSKQYIPEQERKSYNVQPVKPFYNSQQEVIGYDDPYARRSVGFSQPVSEPILRNFEMARARQAEEDARIQENEDKIKNFKPKTSPFREEYIEPGKERKYLITSKNKIDEVIINNKLAGYSDRYLKKSIGFKGTENIKIADIRDKEQYYGLKEYEPLKKIPNKNTVNIDKNIKIETTTGQRIAYIDVPIIKNTATGLESGTKLVAGLVGSTAKGAVKLAWAGAEFMNPIQTEYSDNLISTRLKTPIETWQSFGKLKGDKDVGTLALVSGTTGLSLKFPFLGKILFKGMLVSEGGYLASDNGVAFETKAAEVGVRSIAFPFLISKTTDYAAQKYEPELAKVFESPQELTIKGKALTKESIYTKEIWGAKNIKVKTAEKGQFELSGVTKKYSSEIQTPKEYRNVVEDVVTGYKITRKAPDYKETLLIKEGEPTTSILQRKIGKNKYKVFSEIENLADGNVKVTSNIFKNNRPISTKLKISKTYEGEIPILSISRELKPIVKKIDMPKSELYLESITQPRFYDKLTYPPEGWKGTSDKILDEAMGSGITVQSEKFYIKGKRITKPAEGSNAGMMEINFDTFGNYKGEGIVKSKFGTPQEEGFYSAGFIEIGETGKPTLATDFLKTGTNIEFVKNAKPTVSKFELDFKELRFESNVKPDVIANINMKSQTTITGKWYKTGTSPLNENFNYLKAKESLIKKIGKTQYNINTGDLTGGSSGSGNQQNYILQDLGMESATSAVQIQLPKIESQKSFEVLNNLIPPTSMEYVPNLKSSSYKFAQQKFETTNNQKNFIKSKLETKSKNIQKGLPVSINLIKSVPISININKSVPIMKNIQKNVPVSVNIQKQVPVAVNIQKNVPVSVNIQKQVPVAISIQKTIPIKTVIPKKTPVSIKPYIPPFTPPKIPLLNIKSKSKKRKIKKIKQIADFSKYSPSLAAIDLNIRAKKGYNAGKKLSGLELRPLLY